jgi:2-isopropylmalate synthase
MELGVANSVTAVQHGVTHVQGTINGYGERIGNANLVSIVPILQLKLGYKVVPKQNMKMLTDLSRFVAEICNMPVQSNQPFVGRSGFAHKAGVHVNAMAKNAQTYEHLDPEEVGNERRFLISELSGKTNVLLKSREMNLGLDKDSPETKQILSKITELENQGYQFEAAEASLELLIKKIMGKYKPYFEFCGFRVVDEVQADHTNISRASVDVKVDGREEHSEAQGDGPVNALDQALRSALVRFYPSLQKIHLTDYKVRVINSEAGTAAKVRVFIQFSDDKNRWSTVGVSENVIEASWLALVDAIEYKLMKEK